MSRNSLLCSLSTGWLAHGSHSTGDGLGDCQRCLRPDWRSGPGPCSPPEDTTLCCAGRWASRVGDEWDLPRGPDTAGGRRCHIFPVTSLLNVTPGCPPAPANRRGLARPPPERASPVPPLLPSPRGHRAGVFAGSGTPLRVAASDSCCSDGTIPRQNGLVFSPFPSGHRPRPFKNTTSE